MKYEPTELGVRLGENVRVLREKMGMTQQTLASALTERLGVVMQPITVLRIEKGTRATTVDELGALAEILEVPSEHLLTLHSSELGLRAELQTLLQRTQMAHLSAMSAVGTFEEAQAELETWWRANRGAQTDGASGTDVTTWVDRNRARALLKVVFDETEREVEI